MTIVKNLINCIHKCVVNCHETIPSKNDNGCRDFIVPGYKDYAKELHCEARTAYIV